MKRHFDTSTDTKPRHQQQNGGDIKANVNGNENGPVAEKRRALQCRRHFWIDSLLEANNNSKQQQSQQHNQQNQQKSAAVIGGNSNTNSTMKRHRKGKGSEDNRGRGRRPVVIDNGSGGTAHGCSSSTSPPLDERNWLPARSDPEALRSLQCQLDNRETWRQFDQLGTEMIITKSGRRMFPVLRLRFSGTRPDCMYLVYLDLVPVQGEHRFRYAYNKSQWQSGGKADRAKFGRLYLHTDSPFTGEQLSQPGHVISFDKAKLTNNGDGHNSPGDQLLLNSMHKYRPRVHVVCVPRGHPALAELPREFRCPADLDRLAMLEYKTFSFQSTSFVAVTAYQNQLVTQKKIELNPFAKGFRDQQQKADNCSTDYSKRSPPHPSPPSAVPPSGPVAAASPPTVTLPFPHVFRPPPPPMPSSWMMPAALAFRLLFPSASYGGAAGGGGCFAPVEVDAQRQQQTAMMTAAANESGPVEEEEEQQPHQNQKHHDDNDDEQDDNDDEQDDDNDQQDEVAGGGKDLIVSRRKSPEEPPPLTPLSTTKHCHVVVQQVAVE